jgi:hypothetical protein
VVRRKYSLSIAVFALAIVGLSGVRLLSAQTADSEKIILGRPTAESIVVQVAAVEASQVFAQYGRTSGDYTERSAVVEASLDGLAEITIDDLEPDSRYFYRVSYRAGNESDYRMGAEYSFHTQRTKGSTFTFGVQGDSHPERLGNMYSPDLYRRTLRQVASAQPDLYFMLGDDFSISNQMPDFYQGDRAALNQRVVDDVYLNQRNFLSTMAHSTALFMVNGNHEEARGHFLGTPLHDVSIFAGRARKRFFPLPAPDDFYSVNPERVPGIGLLKDYYAFEWGDALFVMIDPYWSSPVPVGNSGGGGMGAGASLSEDEQWTRLTRTARDRWASTMGDAQYEWFRETLMESDARYKFVFAHHVLGVGRGGIERAKDYEWGGYSPDGTWEFDERRPGWELPVHQTMVKYGVTIFFQAHDHIFVRQELDGIVYQSVPNPADDTYTGRNKDAYLTGDSLDSSGYLEVTISPQDLKVDYIRSWLPKDEVDGRRQGEVAYSYSIE